MPHGLASLPLERGASRILRVRWIPPGSISHFHPRFWTVDGQDSSESVTVALPSDEWLQLAQYKGFCCVSCTDRGVFVVPKAQRKATSRSFRRKNLRNTFRTSIRVACNRVSEESVKLRTSIRRNRRNLRPEAPSRNIGRRLSRALSIRLGKPTFTQRTSIRLCRTSIRVSRTWS